MTAINFIKDRGREKREAPIFEFIFKILIENI